MRYFSKEIYLKIIFFRIFLDASLLIPEARALAINWGWPINDFWALTLIPVVVVMGTISIRAILQKKLDFTGCLILCAVPIMWSVILIVMAEHWTMVADGVSWIIVAGLAILYKISEE